jgi:hypothetical protein
MGSPKISMIGSTPNPAVVGAAINPPFRLAVVFAMETGPYELKSVL